MELLSESFVPDFFHLAKFSRASPTVYVAVFIHLYCGVDAQCSVAVGTVALCPLEDDPCILPVFDV